MPIVFGGCPPWLAAEVFCLGLDLLFTLGGIVCVPNLGGFELGKVEVLTRSAFFKVEVLSVVLGGLLFSASIDAVSWPKETAWSLELKLSNLFVLRFPSGEAVGGLFGGLPSGDSLRSRPKYLAFNVEICSRLD